MPFAGIQHCRLFWPPSPTTVQLLFGDSNYEVAVTPANALLMFHACAENVIGIPKDECAPRNIVYLFGRYAAWPCKLLHKAIE